MEQVLYYILDWLIGCLCGIGLFCFLNQCKHEYEIVDQLRKTHGYTNRWYSMVYVSRCKKCGKIKSKGVS